MTLWCVLHGAAHGGLGLCRAPLTRRKRSRPPCSRPITGFRTHEQVTRELGGGDWEDNVAELAHENEQLKAAGSEGVIETTESVTTQGGKENAESTE